MDELNEILQELERGYLIEEFHTSKQIRDRAKARLTAWRDKAVAEVASSRVEPLRVEASAVEYIKQSILSAYSDEAYATKHRDFLNGIQAGYTAAKADVIVALTQPLQKEEKPNG